LFKKTLLFHFGQNNQIDADPDPEKILLSQFESQISELGGNFDRIMKQDARSSVVGDKGTDESYDPG
jgi:hypothetical protein